MIVYDDFLRFAPPGGTREERDAWFEAHEFDTDALLRVSREVAQHRLQALEDGDQIGEQELTLALQSAMLFGFELAVRVLTNDAPTPADPDANGSGG